MTNKPLIFRLASVAAMAVLCLSATTGVQAATVSGSIGMADIQDGTLADGSEFGNINTATSFVLGSWTSHLSGSGIFSGIGAQSFGVVPFQPGNMTSVMFSTPAFGTFTSTSIMQPVNVPSFRGFLVDGNWMPGTFFNGMGLPADIPSMLTITFTQSPAHTGDVTVAGSFTVTTTVTGAPEPSSLALSLAGLGSLGFVSLFRRRRRDLAMA